MPAVPSATPTTAAFQPVPDQRILQGVAATATVTLLDQDGIATDAASTVTVQVVRSDGTVLLAAGTPTTHGATGVYTAALTAAQTANLDTLTAVWTDTTSGGTRTTHIEVVGGYYLNIGQIRGLGNLSDTTKFPNADLIQGRLWFENTFERYTGRAFVPRFRRVTLWGHGTDTLHLPDQYIRRLVSVSFGTVSLSAEALANTVVTADGRLQRYWPFLSNATDVSWGVFGQQFPTGTRVTVGYEYGLDAPTGDIVEAAEIAIRDKLLNDRTGRPMLTIADGAGGTTRFAMPGPDRPFGIPDVDIVANNWQRNDRQRDTLTVGTVPIA